MVLHASSAVGQLVEVVESNAKEQGPLILATDESRSDTSVLVSDSYLDQEPLGEHSLRGFQTVAGHGQKLCSWIRPSPDING